MERSLTTIAYEIRRTWLKVHYSAEPYLIAMASLTTLADQYGYDDARGIVLRFLGNASTWRGEDAKRIKAELRVMLKGKQEKLPICIYCNDNDSDDCSC